MSALKDNSSCASERLYAAHISEDGRIQSILEHLNGTARRASAFAERFGACEYAYLCGMLHDIGKYSAAFQKRIRGDSLRTDHSTAGAKEVETLLKRAGFLFSYCIAGHHAGLPNGGTQADTCEAATLQGRLHKVIESYDAYKEEVNIGEYLPKTAPALKCIKKQGFSLSFFIRMLFSCLVDADFLDTEAFMSGGERLNCGENINVLLERLRQHLKKFENPETDINKKRSDILNNCLNKAGAGRGLYTLTVPTGGGKTIASIAFALKHAKTHRIDRIIYVIPYNSIIEQNANVFRNIFGSKNILEHHSNYSYDDNEESTKILRLATENWDMPIIVTTTVQFFESLFSNKPSHCRKLHNIANSVIIFDEAQMLPIDYLLPCVRAISELVINYHSTAVLCSATQPALEKFFPKELQAKELCENTEGLYEFFKRTRFELLGEISDLELLKRLNSEKQVLCIVSTRKQAQALFNLLEGEGCFHLSTLMFPKHRKVVLNEIRERLNQGHNCRVVSTSLIEAGVDIDFPVVYKAQAGLDSEIQAAGRCNREGKHGISPVYIFKPEKMYRDSLPSMLKRPLQVTVAIEDEYSDLSAPLSISAYFKLLYTVTDKGIDKKNIVDRFEEGVEIGCSFPFETVSEEFKLIEQTTHSIIIAIDNDSKALVERLKNNERSRELMQNAQQYSVNVYDNHYRDLLATGSIGIIDDQLAVLTDEKLYSEKFGLLLGKGGGQGIFI